MTVNKITVNGQQFDSPEAMPPDVRLMYEKAMRTMASLPAGRASGGTTQVFTGHAGKLGASMVVNRIVTVNDRTFGSVDELPPDVRQLYEDALKTPGTIHPKTSLHVSVNVAGPEVRTVDGSGSRPTPPSFPIAGPSTETTLRRLPLSLAIIVVIGLVLWLLLGR
jgi:hypothetical protein